MENDSGPLSRNPCGSALNKPHDGVSLALLSGRALTEGIIRMAKHIIYRSLVVVAVHQGDEVLALLPGTIIRSDGVVATCASGLSFRTVKELRVTVKILGEQVTHEGALLGADFSSKFAFIKFKSPGQLRVPTFAKAFVGMRGVAVGCRGQGPGLRDIGFHYLPASLCVVNENENKQSHAMTFGQAEFFDGGFRLPALICDVVNENENKQSHAMTSRRVIRGFAEGIAKFIGGAFVEPWNGLLGVIHYQYGSEIKATPMDEVLKCLEHLENSWLKTTMMENRMILDNLDLDGFDKTNKKAGGDEYSAFAIFKNQQEANQVFESVNGNKEKDSSGLLQKCASFQLDSGMSGSIYVRKMAHDDPLGQISLRKRPLRVEETTAESIKFISDWVVVEQTEPGLDACDDHAKEIKRLKQELKQRDEEISCLNKLVVALTRKQGL